MPDTSSHAHSMPVSSPDVKEEERLASCYSCKKSKVKCVRPDGVATCSRCISRNLECTAPLFHVGRHKGVKNKHSGLEKAVIQIEQALKRSNPGSDQIQDSEQSTELRYLLERSRDLLGAERAQVHRRASSSGTNIIRRQSVVTASPQHSTTSHGTSPSQTESRDGGPGSRVADDDQLNLDDAENPLQLLARTSEMLSSSGPPNGWPALNGLSSKALPSRERMGVDGRDGNLPVFFGRFQPRLDVGPELDPIELGLLTLAEAERLFAYFFENLAHTRWGIDPVLHTVDFVRRCSAFLFTSIAAASALFSHSMEALHRRLSRHRQKLADLVMTKRYKSVEIVLAFMVNIPWIPAGDHWADDETSTYMSMALSVAVDLYLNKIILPGSPDAPFSVENIPSSDQISSRRALNMDGFTTVDPVSDFGRRLLRRRERTWLSLFVLERGTCLARGRSYMLPMSLLIENCDRWHLCNLADRWDGSIVSVAVLRRDLAHLIDSLRKICNSYVNGFAETTVVENLKNEITMFFNKWYQTWPYQIGDREQFALPPYVEILASHTRLSMYSSIINHSTAPVGARHYFRAAGLSSALNVLRVAVQGEGQLRSMPNNTAIMISFAACFALRVSAVADGRGSSLAPSIRALIGETIDVLDRIGSTPVQRKGLSCLFAGQLRQILKFAVRSAETARVVPPLGESNIAVSNNHAYANPNATGMNGHNSYPHPGGRGAAQVVGNAIATANAANGGGGGQVATAQMQQQQQQQIPTGGAGNGMPSDYLLFSTMSNDQLNEAINNTDMGLGGLLEEIPFQQASELDWMDWSTFG
ncbi:hypothetical protein F4808DRAFT_464199 [Astrocystis sublimbata]|nr:hypothetical protein F4808DRAFT_464199 [Astrocystis sublimbata]